MSTVSSRLYLKTWSAPNILRNGGFETKDEDFWIVVGAGEGFATTYKVITTDDAESSVGCLNYLETQVATEENVTVVQYFSTVAGEYVDIEYANPRFDVTMGLPALDLGLRFTPLTMGLSYKVRGGIAAVHALFIEEDRSALPYVRTQSFVELDDMAGINAWRRKTARHEGTTNPDIYVIGAGVALTRISGSPTVQLGNIQLIEGLYDHAPYTGCLFSQAFPKGAILLSLSSIPPAGFELIYEGQSFFVRNGQPGQTGGTTHHEHNFNQYMSDHTNSGNNDDWYKRSFVADKNIFDINQSLEDTVTFIDDGTVAHDHTIESSGGPTSDNTTPLWRGYSLCRKK